MPHWMDDEEVMARVFGRRHEGIESDYVRRGVNWVYGNGYVAFADGGGEAALDLADIESGEYRRVKRLRGSNMDPPAKRRVIFDDGDIELKDMSSMQVDGRSSARMYMSGPVGRGPRRKVVHGRRRKVKTRQKLMYSANLANPSTCIRTDAVVVSAPANMQSVVVNLLGAYNLQESQIARTAAQLTALPINEISVDYDNDNGNFHNGNKVGVLRHVVDYGAAPTSPITAVSAIGGGNNATLRHTSCSVRPAMAWTLMDNWMWRDMALYCGNKYQNQIALSSGYSPPQSSLPLGGQATSIVLAPGTTSATNYDTSGVTTCAVSDFVSTNDSTYQGVVDNPGIGGRGKHLYVHNASIKFEVENLENSGVFVEVYELTMRTSERFKYAGTENVTIGSSTAYPTGKFVDPVELWHSKLRRWAGTLGQPLTLGNNQDGAADQGVELAGQMNRFSIYHCGQDATRWLSNEYYVSKKVLRVPEGGKGVISFTVNHQNYIPSTWWDKYYGIKGLTRAYMMVVKGDRAVVGTSSVSQQGTSDANVRVNVVKAWKAGFGLIRERNSYIERKLRIGSGYITSVLAVSQDGKLTNDDEIGGINTTVADQVRTYGTAAGNLMVDVAPVV